MFSFEPSEDDAPAFLERVRHIVSGAVRTHRTDEVYIVRIDNWFDRKWLGFSGTGRVEFPGGAWIETALDEFRKDELTLPPFTPNRVRSRRRFIWNAYADRFIKAHLRHRLHVGRHSCMNLREPISRIGSSVAFAWYSGNTAENDSGSLMMYVHRDDLTVAWYASFARKNQWRIEAVTGLSTEQLEHFEEVGRSMDDERRKKVPTESERLIERLHDAASRGALAAVSEALADGADLEGRDADGRTPLLTAVWAAEADGFQHLLEAGSNPFQEDYIGRSALHGAVCAWPVDNEVALATVRTLIERGVAIDARDCDGWTPLMISAGKGYEEMVEELIEAGADVRAKNREGATSLHWASEGGHAEVAERLIRSGAKVGAKNKLGSTPVLYAALSGKDRIIEILHDAGASVTVKNRRGWTPLAIATSYGLASTVALLRRLGATD
jgi:ankyrin repeat protein